jgi:hypothetical protein
MVCTLDGTKVNANFNNLADFFLLLTRAKELSQTFEGADEVQYFLDNARFKFEGVKEGIRVDINIIYILFNKEELLKGREIPNEVFEYCSLLDYIFEGLELEEGFYFRVKGAE